MKLYGSLTSPYVRKVRILLQEKNIPCEFVVADAWAADSPIPALNPLGKVPALQRGDGQVLFDSPLICEYLDRKSGEPLIPRDGEERWQVLRWHALGQGILDATVSRLLEGRRPAEKQSAESIARQEGKITNALVFADQGHSDGPYLVNARFGYADISLAVALEYVDFRYPHPWREKHPRLSQWLADIAKRPSFAETTPPGVERPAGSAR